MRAPKKQGGKGLRYGTADHVRRVLSKALTWAKARGLVFENFAQYVQIDPDSEPFEQKPMSHEDISKFIFSLESEEVFDLAFKLSLVTGARPGEILGLKFSDFDFLNNTVCIRRQVCILIPAKETPDGKAIYGLKEKTKTDKRGKRYNKSLRIEPIPIALMEEVKRKRIKALENKLKHGTNYVDNDLVTCDEFGKFKIVRSFSGRYKRILKRAGLDEHRAYDMRHTFASIMQESNVPIITLANALGHSDTKMLEQHYAKNIQGRHIVANAVNSMYNNTFVSNNL